MRVRVRPDLTLVGAAFSAPLDVDSAFRLAKDLLKHGARHVVMSELDRAAQPVSPRRPKARGSR